MKNGFARASAASQMFNWPTHADAQHHVAYALRVSVACGVSPLEKKFGTVAKWPPLSFATVNFASSFSPG
jgi:hypothetical protein